jgi:hypothetical protein
MSIKPKSGEQYMQEVLARATQDFCKHEKQCIGLGHWHMSRGDGLYWCDIVVMQGGGIAVWGDIDACTFAYSPYSDHVASIHWLASAGVAYYARQKATIGMSDPVAAQEHPPEVAIYDLLMLKKDPDDYSIDAINEAIKDLDNGEHVDLVKQALMEVDTGAWEWVDSIGRVTSTRVICALAAVKRLSALLKERSD